MRKLAAKGHGVVFISHRLDEVLEVTDRVYVYKDGASVGTLKTSEADEAKLYELMVGRNTQSEYYHLEKQIVPQKEVVLSVKDLGLKGVFKGISFDLRKGEILGVCGVVGSGKEELCECLCGDEKATSGTVSMHGKETVLKSPSEGVEKGILMVPKERLAEGIVKTLSVADNIALSNLDKLASGPLISASKVTKQAAEWIERLKVKTGSSKSLMISLSGGNQQKVVFSRALASGCEILILNHPTRGVDVGAKEEIYNLVRDVVAQGKSVILLGDTLDECINLSNRVIVLKDGLVTGEFSAAADDKPEQVDIVKLMM